jgi:hypothetical protein
VVEAPEVPHRGSLLRFCDADSLTLERAYARDADRLQRRWWEEEAERQRGPAAPPPPPPGAAAAAAASPQPADGAADPDADPTWADFMVSEAGEAVGVPLRSGTYEADLEARVAKPCFWPAPRHRLLRGTWFAEKAAGEWVPLREAVAEQLEQAQASAVWADGRGRLAVQDDGTTAGERWPRLLPYRCTLRRTLHCTGTAAAAHALQP